MRLYFCVADFIASSLSDTESTAESRDGVVAISFLNSYTCSACPAALTPSTPIAPTSIDFKGFFTDWYALLIYAPLKTNLEVESFSIRTLAILIWVSNPKVVDLIGSPVGSGYLK